MEFMAIILRSTTNLYCKKLTTCCYVFFLAYSLSFANLTHASSTLINTESVELTAAASLFDEYKIEEAKKAFTKILKNDAKSLDSMLYLARINARQENLDAAEDYMVLALSLAPNNAYVQNLSGQIYSAIAQEASVFTALGYAKKALSGFKEAVNLDTTNIEYKQDLLSFSIGAPSIAGGDVALAKKEADAIQAIDAAKGYVAFIKVYAASEDKKSLFDLLTNTPENLLSNPDVLFNKGIIYLKEENYALAFENFQMATSQINNTLALTDIDILTKDEFEVLKYQTLYQVGKTSEVGNIHLSDGFIALNTYIEEAPLGSHLPNKEWAQFRLANIIAKQGDKNKANDIYQTLAKNTEDKRLKKQIKAML